MVAKVRTKNRVCNLTTNECSAIIHNFRLIPYKTCCIADRLLFIYLHFFPYFVSERIVEKTSSSYFFTRTNNNSTRVREVTCTLHFVSEFL